MSSAQLRIKRKAFPGGQNRGRTPLHIRSDWGGVYMWLGIINEFMHLFNIVKYFKEQEIKYKFLKKGS